MLKGKSIIRKKNLSNYVLLIKKAMQLLHLEHQHFVRSILLNLIRSIILKLVGLVLFWWRLSHVRTKYIRLHGSFIKWPEKQSSGCWTERKDVKTTENTNRNLNLSPRYIVDYIFYYFNELKSCCYIYISTLFIKSEATSQLLWNKMNWLLSLRLLFQHVPFCHCSSHYSS